MSTGLGVLLVLAGWVVAWLVALLGGYERKPKRRDLWGLVFAFYVLKTGRALPACTYKTQGDVAEQDGVRYSCDASLGQWLRLTTKETGK